MNGMSRALGAGATIKLGGKTYTLRPFTNAVIAAMEQEILSRRGNAIELAVESIEKMGNRLSESAQRTLLEKAMEVQSKQRNYVDEQEFAEFSESRYGVAFTLWLMLKQDAPDLTLERLQELVAEASEAEFYKLMNARDKAGGVDEMGNGIGPVTSEGELGDSTGEKQSETSSKPTPESHPETSPK